MLGLVLGGLTDSDRVLGLVLGGVTDRVLGLLLGGVTDRVLDQGATRLTRHAGMALGRP